MSGELAEALGRLRVMVAEADGLRRMREKARADVVAEAQAVAWWRKALCLHRWAPATLADFMPYWAPWPGERWLAQCSRCRAARWRNG